MARKQETIEHVEESIKRWKTRLKRALTAIDKLEKKKKRLASRKTKPEPLGVTYFREIAAETTAATNVEPPAPPPQAPALASVDDLAIPTFLQRKRDSEMRDKIAADAIRAEQAERKQSKARARRETAKAKQAGDLKRMPLTGRAALEKLRTG